MGDKKISEHPLLKKLVGSETKGVISLRGYVGPSDTPGHIRLYANLEDLTQSIEVPEEEILHVDNLPESVLPNGALSIWVDKTASVVEKFERAHSAAMGSNVLRRGRLEIKVPNKVGDLQSVCQSVCGVCQSVCGVCQSVCGVCQSVCQARVGNRPQFGNPRPPGNFNAVCQSVCGVCQSVCQARVGNRPQFKNPNLRKPGMGNLRNPGNFSSVCQSVCGVCQSVCGVCQSVCQARLGNPSIRNPRGPGNLSAVCQSVCGVCQSVCGVCQSVCSARLNPNMPNLHGARNSFRNNVRNR